MENQIILQRFVFFSQVKELMRGVGKGLKEFNSAKATLESEIKEGMKEEEKLELKDKKKA